MSIRLWSLPVFAALLALGLGPRPASAAFKFEFIACGFVSGCPAPTKIVTFELDRTTVLAAPPLGPGNGFESPRIPLTPLRVLEGGLSAAYIFSYRNVFGVEGSAFLLDGLLPANGGRYGSLALVAGFVGGPVREALTWPPGLYTSLIIVECFGGLACPGTTGALDRVRIRITDTTAVPAPAAAGLLALGLVGLGAVRRRRA